MTLSRKALWVALAGVLALGAGTAGRAAGAGEDAPSVRPTDEKRDGAPLYRVELLSPVYTIDRIYKSMQGPMAAQSQRLLPAEGGAELLWLTGYEAEVTDAIGEQPRSSEFMCHSAVDARATDYHRLIPTRMTLRGSRVFSVDQGTVAQRLPEGFGVPLMSSQPLFVATQVLNHNVVGEPFRVRQRVTFEFVRNRDLEKPLVPLIQHGIFGLVLVSGADGHFGVAPGAGEESEHGPGCSLGEDKGDPRGFVMDRYGRRMSSFWVVEPGRHTYHTRVTEFLDLPYDTTVHYAAAHLHPFAESIELYDLTDEKTLIKLRTTQREGGIGLAEVESFSSVNGVPLFQDHEYDLISVYDNTSGKEQDAMATLLLYVRVRDLEFLPHGDESTRVWRKVVPPRL